MWCRDGTPAIRDPVVSDIPVLYVIGEPNADYICTRRSTAHHSNLVGLPGEFAPVFTSTASSSTTIAPIHARRPLLSQTPTAPRTKRLGNRRHHLFCRAKRFRTATVAVATTRDEATLNFVSADGVPKPRRAIWFDAYKNSVPFKFFYGAGRTKFDPSEAGPYISISARVSAIVAVIHLTSQLFPTMSYPPSSTGNSLRSRRFLSPVEVEVMTISYPPELDVPDLVKPGHSTTPRDFRFHCVPENEGVLTGGPEQSISGSPLAHCFC